jgi:hypothetical protein
VDLRVRLVVFIPVLHEQVEGFGHVVEFKVEFDVK